MKKREFAKKLIILVGTMTLALAGAGIAFAGDGTPEGKPFKDLQKQVDDLKTIVEALQQSGVSGYEKVESNYFAGRYPGYVYGSGVTCPLGMKPVGGGGEGIAYEGGKEKYDVFLMTASKPNEYVCEYPADGGPPNTYYGWEVQWLNTYSGSSPYVSSVLNVYALCVGEAKPDLGCN